MSEKSRVQPARLVPSNRTAFLSLVCLVPRESPLFPYPFAFHRAGSTRASRDRCFAAAHRRSALPLGQRLGPEPNGAEGVSRHIQAHPVRLLAERRKLKEPSRRGKLLPFCACEAQ